MSFNLTVNFDLMLVLSARRRRGAKVHDTVLNPGAYDAAVSQAGRQTLRDQACSIQQQHPVPLLGLVEKSEAAIAD